MNEVKETDENKNSIKYKYIDLTEKLEIIKNEYPGFHKDISLLVPKDDTKIRK